MESSSVPKWYVLARAELGTAEVVGPEHNPRVLAYYRMAGHSEIKDDETAWCAAFACAMLELAQTRSPRTLLARDFLKWGDETEPRLGCVVVLKRGTSSWQGHVGFVERFSDDGWYVLVLAGNQGNKVSYQWFPVTDVLGYRWPKQSVGEWQTVVHHEPPQPPRPTPIPVLDFETRDVVEDKLRASGSRIISAADRTETGQKVVGTVGLMAIVSSVMSFFTDLYSTLSPLAPFLGMTALGLICLGLAIYTLHDQKRIKAARVDDHLKGLHLGRRDDAEETQ